MRRKGKEEIQITAKEAGKQPKESRPERKAKEGEESSEQKEASKEEVRKFILNRNRDECTSTSCNDCK